MRIDDLREGLRSFLWARAFIIGGLGIAGLVAAALMGFARTYLLLLALAVFGFTLYGALRLRQRRVLSRTRFVGFGSPDDTAELPAIDGSKPRELIEYEDGTTSLVVRERKIVRRHVFAKPERTMVRSEIELADSYLVGKRLAKHSTFKPIQGESKVFVFTRLHWVEHAPLQIALVAAAIAVTVGLCLTAAFGALSVSAAGWLLIWLVLMLAAAAGYLYVWIPWAYTWLVVTDRRIMLMYAPPLWIEGSPMRAVLFTDVGTSNHEDQHGFTNWLLGKLGQTPYGIIQADTAADKGDEWVNEGIRYVRHPEEVKRVIDERLLAIKSLQLQERHAEDMAYQRRQAEAAEETLGATREMRDLLRHHLERQSQGGQPS